MLKHESQETEAEAHWVDPSTCEIVAEGTPGAVLMEFKVPKPPPEKDWDADLGNWLSRKLVENAATTEALIAQHEKRLKTLKAERRALERHLPRMEEIATEALKGSKRKSVPYDFGTFKFTTSTKTVVDDDFEALLWAEENCPEAVKRTPPKLLVSKFPKDVEVPGVSKKKSTKFSFSAAKAKK